MGILHKLTLALQRIDPGNQRWQALQKERARQRADEAFETKDQQERDAELLEISETFERYSGDFGRKLYLIQNSIFGRRYSAGGLPNRQAALFHFAGD